MRGPLALPLPVEEVHPQGGVPLLLVPAMEPPVGQRGRRASLLELAAGLRGALVGLRFDVHLR